MSTQYIIGIIICHALVSALLLFLCVFWYRRVKEYEEIEKIWGEYIKTRKRIALRRQYDDAYSKYYKRRK